MKGLVQSVGAAAVIAVGVNGQSPGSGPALNHEGGAASVGAGSPGILKSDGRLLQSIRARDDDALDINGTPFDRAANALQLRTSFAEIEFQASEDTFHTNNGDRSSAGSFHKTLPHDKLGQVDPAAFDLLVECIADGDFDKCEEVPAGDGAGFLIQPIGGLAVDMAGPASSALSVPEAPALNSEDLAAQLAELYWMALARDVPFNQYGEDETTIAAADNLATMPGFANMNGVAVGPDGRADPQSQLFRSTAVGVETGPMISQLLVKDFTIDSLTVTPRQTTFETGADYLTDFDEWLDIQNGLMPEEMEREDIVKRFIRNARDLSRLVATDTIYTEAFRGALILLGEGAITDGANGPYAASSRQRGFPGFGVSHLMRILATAEASQRSSWYQKWNVHLFARPEAVAGTLHNVILGKLDVEFDASLLGNEELLERVASRNEEVNGAGATMGRTYLLSQAVREGSPSHPSYPAGHAVQNGAFATVLKAFVGLEKGLDCFDDPVFPDDEGLDLLPYDGCLTFEGEINKLAVNVAFGRQMCGVHYRTDSVEGLLLGEIVAVRLLQQEIMGFPESGGFEFRLMAGETIRIESDGTFFVNDKKCSSENFQGVDAC